ncbi:transporter substrate-binding domain-containing protein [Azotobacter chroococcum]|uniref:Transporter substrate-binding domain-containing protein n=1 Tax=Azotobacter chroococcum TaxID=353 RepID=A0AA43Z347_9GAMM|nr:transporter substrate-binding domain-containing protein [Azotobacter chroococcum]MEE4463612.1 transporter substrate-binding domain-containing protein [Azotobacter chroococcum]NHN75750.1 transporter substrate-binding domain-containing protein [Azotobacter chroococcum]TBW11581.1 transporter substrate-binding domain-containing protein [Azotobacter chroococcum subsp. isscasi]
MRRLWSTLLLCGCLLGVAAAEAWGTPLAGLSPPEEILLVGVERKGHTGADASGLVWEVLRLVFEPAGLRVRTGTVPYIRAVGLVTRGDADAWVGAYPEETAGALFPKWHYAAEVIAALGLSRTPEPRLEDLGNFRLAWIRGYAFDKYLPRLQRYQEIQRYNGSLAMLRLGHADYLIAARAELEGVLAWAENPEAYRITDLTLLPLYPGFADTPRGRELAALYDRRMAELVRSGELRPIFTRWQQPYPFD